MISLTLEACATSAKTILGINSIEIKAANKNELTIFAFSLEMFK
jgi:hypothetical protein